MNDESEYSSPIDGRETNCMKEFLLSEQTEEQPYFVLNSDSLIGDDYGWQSYREYTIDLKQILLSNNLEHLIENFDPNDSEKALSFVGIQLLLAQNYQDLLGDLTGSMDLSSWQ